MFDCPTTPVVECTGREGLGDWVEGLLSSVGITKDRYAAAKEFLGMPPDCGCNERQKQLTDWMNRATEWWRGIQI